MLAPAGLDAGLLVNAENVIAWPQCCTFPTALVKIEDATSLAGELRITREDPSAMTPGPQCVLAEPAPQGGAADLCHDAARHRLVAQFGDRPVRQGQTSTRRQLTRQCLDRNDDTGGKTGRSPASRQVIKTGKSLETEAPTPLADDLARHVEAGSDALVAKPPVRQEYNLGPHNVAVWRRIVLGPDYQFGSLSLCELDQIGAFSGHDASSWPRTILPCPYESLKNTSPYLWNRVLSRMRSDARRLRRPAKRLARTPNAGKNHAELSCQRDARLANPGPLRNSLRPILQTRSLLDPRQDHDSRLVHQCADKRIATLRNPAATVDLPRLILPWCQPHVRADRPRSGKAGRVLDRTDIGQHSDDPDTGYAHQKSARRVLLRQRAHRFIEDRNLFTQLSPCRQHGSDDRRQVITLGEQSLDPSVERKASHCTRQHSKRLEHAPDMVRQTRRHADELRSCTKQRTCPMGIERFHVHRPIPSRAHDLREPLGIVPVGLVHLHLECGTGMSRIEANNVKPSLAQFMHKPRRHRAGFDPNAGIVSRMPSHRPLNLLRICMTLASPESATRIVNHADRSQLLRNVQTNKSGHRAVSHVRTAGQQRPDHGTMERSGPQPRLPDCTRRRENPSMKWPGCPVAPE